MKNLYLLFISLILFSCSQQNPEFESNKALAQKWIQSFENNDLDLWKEVVSEDVTDQSPVYGAGLLDYNGSIQTAQFYINNFKNIKFIDAVWLPGIDTTSLKPDGSVRAYGTWTGESISTGRKFSNSAYHNFGFKDGKIVSTGEFFDATGMVNSVGPNHKNLIIATLHIKPGKYNEVQALMDSDSGLSITRNYDGCTLVEVTYNEASGIYFIVENWESSEQYQKYLNWRMTEDASGLVGKVMPLLVGEQSGFKVYDPNSNYKFY